MDENILDRLNDVQKEAVCHIGSPLLILAGPGSGKTLVITTKIAWLINEVGVPARNILAMTFTNKASKEMAARVSRLVNYAETVPMWMRPTIRTFHSFGVRFLRRFHKESHLTSGFQIYDSEDQLSLMKEANPRYDANKAKLFVKQISFAKDCGISSTASDEEIERYIFDPQVYRNYELLKHKTGNVDFGDLLLKPLELLQKNDEILQQFREYWQWFLIDEYQDSNAIQYLLLTAMCGNSANLCVVGDDDQSIYKFRGASVENILNFEKNFRNTSTVRLEQNYRSSPQIVALARQVVSCNRIRHEKNIFSNQDATENPKVCIMLNEYDEFDFVVERAQYANNSNTTLAIFFRINALSRGYEMAFMRAGISYTVVGTTGFFERKEVKDAIAFARLFKNPNDFLSFIRIANKPARGIGNTTMKKITDRMKDGVSWYDAIAALSSSVGAKAKKGFEELQAVYNLFQKSYTTIGEAIQEILRESKVLAFYKQEDETNDTERMRNIQEFLSYASNFQNTDEAWNTFLEQISLAEGVPTDEHSNIQLMSLHRSKGLEFDSVIICGLEETVFPLSGGNNMSANDGIDIEEERRLLYVGITRARTQLFLTTCAQRRRYGHLENMVPSRFLNEMADGNVVDVYEYPAVAQKSTDSFNGIQEEWHVGDKVYHKEYGVGYVHVVRNSGKHLVIQVEFIDDYEATFIPKFANDLKKIYDNE